MPERVDLASDDWHKQVRIMEAAMQRAVQEALLVHKRLGHSIVVSRDGEVVILPPEEIPVEDPGGSVAAAD